MRNHGGVAIWPAWATGAVEVCPADPQWQWLDEGLTGELDVALTCWLVAPVEHVRSTAVPGWAAKPILDLQAGFADLDCAPMIAEALGSGWHLVPRGLDRQAVAPVPGPGLRRRTGGPPAPLFKTLVGAPDRYIGNSVSFSLVVPGRRETSFSAYWL